MVRHGVFDAAVGVVAMRFRVRALVRVLVVVVALATLSATADAFPASASVAPAPAELSMSGDVELLPGVDFFHVAMHASQHATDPVAGSFAGNGELRGAGFDVPIPLSLAGPVTCLTTRGDTAAFLYPVTSATPPLLQELLQNKTSVLFTVTKGAHGAPDRVGFIGPLPPQLFHGCQPTGTPFVFHGAVTIEGRSLL
ncbi:MAG: hypothetical protein ACXVXI_07560 [Mycobacteriaceae bacterium]